MSYSVKNNFEDVSSIKSYVPLQHIIKKPSSLSSSASEFTPQISASKSLNASALDFKPEISLLTKSDFIPEISPNLKADAPVFEINFEPQLSMNKIKEFISEHIPDEKFDDPTFVIKNRELTEEDLNIEIIEEVIKIDTRNIYDYEEILNIYKIIQKCSNFEQLTDNIKNFACRVMNTYKIKHQKRNNAKANKD